MSKFDDELVIDDNIEEETDEDERAFYDEIDEEYPEGLRNA